MSGADLKRQDWTPRSLAAWGEEFAYRAAILQYDGGFDIVEAERRALIIVGPYTRVMDRANRNNPRET